MTIDGRPVRTSTRPGSDTATRRRRELGQVDGGQHADRQRHGARPQHQQHSADDGVRDAAARLAEKGRRLREEGPAIAPAPRFATEKTTIPSTATANSAASVASTSIAG